MVLDEQSSYLGKKAGASIGEEIKVKAISLKKWNALVLPTSLGGWM